MVRRIKTLGWGDGSVVESTCCSFRGPEFSFLAPTSGSFQLPVIIPGDPTPSSSLSGHTHMCRYRHTYTKKNLN